MPKVSVVVPMYNVEKTLKACIESIQNQTLKDIEIICVNDGSKDTTLDIINEIAKNDSRITVISQENQGLGGARNTGINAVKGEYIGFVDSDDTVDPTMFEKLYNAALKNDCDVAFCSTRAVDIYGNDHTNDYYLDTIIEHLAEKKIYYDDLKPYFVYLATAVWNRIYRTEFLNKNNFRFQRILYEDYPFWCDVFLNANAFYFVNEPLYNYLVMRMDSLINQYECKINIYYVLSCVKKSFEAKGKFGDIETGYWNSYAIHSHNLIKMYCERRPEIYEYTRNIILNLWDEINFDKLKPADKKFFNSIRKYEDINRYKFHCIETFSDRISKFCYYIYKDSLDYKTRYIAEYTAKTIKRTLRQIKNNIRRKLHL